MQYKKGNGEFIELDGAIVEVDALNVVERIRNYDEKLDVMCIDPLKAGINDAPFILIWLNNSGQWEKVFEFYELDDRVLERIYNADQQRFDAFTRTVKMEEYVKKQRESRYNEVKDEAKEKMLAAVVNKSSSFSIHNKQGDLVKIHENSPRSINNAKRSFSATGNRFNVKSG